ncbi:MAG: helix-turn-helix transcriptional regulator [Candidatus Eisenbacteria bacterium]|nr:helix-turn-helix transcriptional regulator [Candidatus Eisenbacteria bacterium]
MAVSPCEYLEFRPAHALLPYLECLWRFRVARGVPEFGLAVPPSGGCNLTIMPDGTVFLDGPALEPVHVTVRGGEVYWGARFWPGAAVALLGGDATPPPGGCTPIEQVLGGAEARRLAHETHRSQREADVVAAFERVFGGHLTSAADLDPEIMAGVFRIIGTCGATPIEAIARDVGLSPRQFRRRFAAATGMTPKVLATIRRIRATAAQAAQEATAEWDDIAAHRGYSDQAHLAREFRRLLGFSPTEYLARARQILHRGIPDLTVQGEIQD